MAPKLATLMRRPLDAARAHIEDLGFRRGVRRMERSLASGPALDILGAFSEDRTSSEPVKLRDVEHILTDLDAGTRRIETVLAFFEQRVMVPLRDNARLILDELEDVTKNRNSAESMAEDAALAPEDREYAASLRETCDEMEIALQVAYVRMGVKALVLVEIVERVQRLLEQRSALRKAIDLPLDRQRELIALGETIGDQRNRIVNLVRFSDSGVDALVGAASPALLTSMRDLIERDEVLIDATQVVAETGRALPRPLSRRRSAQLGTIAARDSVELFATVIGDHAEVLGRLRRVTGSGMITEDMSTLSELLNDPGTKGNPQTTFERVQRDLEPRLRLVNVPGSYRDNNVRPKSKRTSDKTPEGIMDELTRNLRNMDGWTIGVMQWFTSLKRRDILSLPQEELVQIIENFYYHEDVVMKILVGGINDSETAPFNDTQLAKIVRGFLEKKTKCEGASPWLDLNARANGDTVELLQHAANHGGHLTKAALIHPYVFQTFWNYNPLNSSFCRPVPDLIGFIAENNELLQYTCEVLLPKLPPQCQTDFIRILLQGPSCTPEVANMFYTYLMGKPDAFSMLLSDNFNQVVLLLSCRHFSTEQLQIALTHFTDKCRRARVNSGSLELTVLSNPNCPEEVRDRYNGRISYKEVQVAIAKNPSTTIAEFKQWLKNGYFRNNISLIEEIVLHPNMTEDFLEALVKEHPEYLGNIVRCKKAPLNMIKTFLQTNSPDKLLLTTWLERDDLDAVVLNNLAPFVVGNDDYDTNLAFLKYERLPQTAIGFYITNKSRDVLSNIASFDGIPKHIKTQIDADLKRGIF